MSWNNIEEIETTCTVQQWTLFYNRDGVCLLRGTDWIFKYMLAQSLTVLPVLTHLTPSDQWATQYTFSLKGFCTSNAMSNTRNFPVFVLKCWLTDMSNIFLDISPIYLRIKFHTTGSNPPAVTPSKPKYSSYCTAYNYAIFVEQKLAYFVQLNYLASFWDTYNCKTKVSLPPHKFAWPPCY
jgi:hypothetical protein